MSLATSEELNTVRSEGPRVPSSRRRPCRSQSQWSIDHIGVMDDLPKLQEPKPKCIIPCLLLVWSLYCGFSDPPSTRKTWRPRPPVWSTRYSAEQAAAPAISRSLKREASQPEDNLRQILISRKGRIAILVACTQHRSPARQPWTSGIAGNSSFFLGLPSHSEVDDFSQLLTPTLRRVFRLLFVVLLVVCPLQWGQLVFPLSFLGAFLRRGVVFFLLLALD